MRISDWSSDVCSSDLAREAAAEAERVAAAFTVERQSLARAIIDAEAGIGSVRSGLQSHLDELTAVMDRISAEAGATGVAFRDEAEHLVAAAARAREAAATLSTDLQRESGQIGRAHV